MIIDAYTHFAPSPYLKSLAKSGDRQAKAAAEHMIGMSRSAPTFTSLEVRLRDLEKYDVGVEVTMIVDRTDPNSFGFAPRDLMRFCKQVNDGIAEVMDRSKGRIVSLGTVPLALLDKGGLEEMRRAVEDLGLKGFMVKTQVGGTPIDKFEKFWKEAARLDVPVWIHPGDVASEEGRPYESDYYLMHVFGWPFETSLMLSRLIFSGVMKRYPNLKILSHHMGGMVPFFAGRVDESYLRTDSSQVREILAGRRKDEPMMSQFKKFYYDTAVGGNRAAVRCGYDVLGADRIVYSTDYPFGPDEGRARLANYPSTIRDLKLSPEEEEKIFEQNARKILSLN